MVNLRFHAHLLVKCLNERRTFVIAEMGSNHGGSLKQAEQLVDAAAEAGAHAIKCQSFLAEDLVLRSDPIFDVLLSLEMPKEWYPVLIKRARSHGLEFMSTITNFLTLDWLEELDVRVLKVASSNINCFPLIERAASVCESIVISTGMGTFEEIQEALNCVQKSVHSVLLYCLSEYPACPKELQFDTIRLLQDAFGIPVGFSDHTTSITPSLVAVSRGSCIIEKHLMLEGSNPSKLPDAPVSISPNEFKSLVKEIALIDSILQNESEVPQDLGESRSVYRRFKRSIHSRRMLSEGVVVQAEDLCFLRSGKAEIGLEPKHFSEIVGKKLNVSLDKESPITWEMFE